MSNFSVLTQADYVLNACGRPVPPPGFRFIDLTYIVPYFGNVPGGGEGDPTYAPSQGRVSNNSKTLFLCKGVVIQNSASVKIKWPSGRYLTQFPLTPDIAPFGPPAGRGGNMYALNRPIPIEGGGRIGIEVSGRHGTNDLQFWGVLRYLIRESDARKHFAELKASDSAASCLVGYPSAAKTVGGGLQLIEDPIAALESRDRILCGPNQNIMAPEWALGNQCTAETPAGYSDESVTFFSQPIVLSPNFSSYSNAVIVPGSDITIVRRFRVITSYSTDDTTGIPTVGIRLPNGYSVTGGDLVPFAAFNVWFPMFPTLAIRGETAGQQGSGGRLILDVGNIQASGPGLITTVVEFDGARRRKA